MVLCANNICLLPWKLTSTRSQLAFSKPLTISSTVVKHGEKSDNSVWEDGKMNSLVIYIIAENTFTIKGTELP